MILFTLILMQLNASSSEVHNTTFYTVLFCSSIYNLMTSGHYSIFTDNCGNSGIVLPIEIIVIILELKNSLASVL